MRLLLCEKPSQAADIAKVLGATQRAQGYFAGEGLVVTYGFGHLLENAQPEDYDLKYKTWSIADLPIIPDHWQMKVKPKTSGQLKIIKGLLAEAKEVIIATDADREGELIAWEILEHFRYRGPTQRLWLSALNQAAIRKAWSALRPSSETLSLYHSALARSRGDWLVGMNMSRLFTLLGRLAGYQGVLSIGRVQTPTLRIVIDRDRAIARFVRSPYWDLVLELEQSASRFAAKWIPPSNCVDEQGRCIDQAVARQAAAAIQAGRVASVRSAITERMKEPAPLPFSLGSLQQACSARLGLGAQETLDVAQSLYETHKATTYPRVDTGYLEESMHAEAPQVLDALMRTDPGIASLIQTLDAGLKSRAWNSAKITAHHGIIPAMEPADLLKMSDKEKAVYRLIRSHYLAQFLPNHEYDKTVIEFDCEGQTLNASGKQVAVVGWKAVVGNAEAEGEEGEKKDKTSEQSLPTLQNGQRCSVVLAQCEQLMTTPPKPMTEGDLIAAMRGAARLVSDPRLKQKLKETTGIGTEATRGGIIKGLLDRGFVAKKGRTLRATDAAFSLIDSAPAAITDPGMTAVWEQALDMVEDGSLSIDDFVAKQSKWIIQMVDRHGSTTLTFKQEPSPACPLCQSPMVQRPGKAGAFWSCRQYPSCKGTMPVEGQKTGGKRKVSRRTKQLSSTPM